MYLLQHIIFSQKYFRMHIILRGEMVGENSVFMFSREGVGMGEESENKIFIEPSTIHYERDPGVPLSYHQHSILEIETWNDSSLITHSVSKLG